MTAALRPAMPVSASHIGDTDAVWVGAVDLGDVPITADVELDGGETFTKARLLVWKSDAVQGFIELEVDQGRITADALNAALGSLAHRASDDVPRPSDGVSVVVCTRDRPADLINCLAALAEVSYPEVEIIVVDSAPSTTATREVVAGWPDVRYVHVSEPGLSRARNAGVRAARHEYIAFTDDDVIVDPRWLAALSRGFGSPAVACVTGLVASGQLQSRSQRYFDRRVSWAQNVSPTTFRLSDPPEQVPLFPFQFGAYGTGANFATRRSTLFELGGFDEALGVGSPTGGGEDIDWFLRVILQGHTLVYQPDALVWHKHRIDDDGLSHQLQNYGLGLGAVLTKLAGDRAARRAMAPLAVRGVRHLWRTVRSGHVTDDAHGIQWHELRGILRGPRALISARAHHHAQPLHQAGPRNQVTRPQPPSDAPKIEYP